MEENLYKKRINKVLTESYHISERLHEYIIPNYIRVIKKEISRCDFSVKNGIKKKEFSFSFDFFDDGKYIFKNFINVFYFDNFENYVEYQQNGNRFINGVIFENKMLIITIVYVDNKPLNNDFYDTIGHEMEHLFQKILMGKNFNNENVYNIARRYINSNNDYFRSLAHIIYASTKSEQEAMINGCYNSFINGEFNFNNIDEDIKKSECGLWLMNLYNAYNFIKSHKNDEELFQAIRDYRKYKDYYDYKYFLYIARNGIKSFERRIAQLTFKIKNKLLNEHVIFQNNIVDLLEYYLIK